MTKMKTSTKLVFDDFDLKTSDGCFDHYVQVFDGLEPHSPNITDKLCHSLPPPVESHDHQMMIIFETDYQSGEKGFSACYSANENAACGGLVSIPATATADISSPDYPLDYPPSTECKWLIDSHQTYNTTFKVSVFRSLERALESNLRR